MNGRGRSPTPMERLQKITYFTQRKAIFETELRKVPQKKLVFGVLWKRKWKSRHCTKWVVKVLNYDTVDTIAGSMCTSMSASLIFENIQSSSSSEIFTDYRLVELFFTGFCVFDYQFPSGPNYSHTQLDLEADMLAFLMCDYNMSKMRFSSIFCW